MRIIFWTAAILSAMSSIASAQQVQKTGGTYFVQTIAGVPKFCGFEFTTIYLDNIYQQGALSAVSGSIVWTDAKQNLGIILKVNGTDFPGAAHLDMSARRFRPNLAFIAPVGQAPMTGKTISCEDPDSYCSINGAPSSLQALSHFMNGDLELVLNRVDGGTDLHIPIKEDPGEPNFAGAKLSFAACLRATSNRLATGAIR